MKNGLLIWNILLSLAAGLLLYLQFSPKKNNKEPVKIPVYDTTYGNQFRIAYFEMDSVEANFNAVRDVKADIEEKEIEKINSQNQLDQVIKNKFNEFSRKSPMKPEDEAAAQNVLKQLSDSIKNEKQEMEQAYQGFVMRKNLEIKKMIGNFIKDFNKTRNFSFIVTDDTGLFYYKDSVYNITSEVVKGLNEQYGRGKK
jgi:outer membrane protein